MGSDGRQRVNRTWALCLGFLAFSLLIYMDVLQLQEDKGIELKDISTEISEHEDSSGTREKFSFERQKKYFRSISGFANRISNDKMVILTFVSYNYRLNAVNWALHMEKLHIANYGFVCLDQKMFLFFKERGVKCYPLYADPIYGFSSFEDSESSPSVDTIKSLWTVRLTILKDLLVAGFDVIYSDVDAVWLRNPLSHEQGLGLLSGHMGDIVASRGKFPAQVSDIWGTTLCMGLIYFRSTKPVISVVSEAEIKAQIYRDDQIAINLALLEEIFSSRSSKENPFKYNTSSLSRAQVNQRLEHEVSNLDPEPMEFALMNENGVGFAHVERLNYLEDRQVAIADIGNVRVALIPHQLVPRCCNILNKVEFGSSVLVAHCHSNDCVIAKTYKSLWGNAKKRVDTMKKYKSWCINRLNDDFRGNSKKSIQFLTQIVDKLLGRNFQLWFEDQLELC